MPGAVAMSGPKADTGNRVGRDQIKSVLIDNPDLRLIKLGYLMSLLLVAAGVLVLLLSISDAAKIGIGYALIMALGSMLTFLLSSHARLRKAKYTVTADYIEAQTGTFEKALTASHSVISEMSRTGSISFRPCSVFPTLRSRRRMAIRWCLRMSAMAVANERSSGS